MQRPSPEPPKKALTAWHKDPSSLSAVMEVAHQAISCGRLGEALRHADRAWRLSPQSPFVCQMLMTLHMQAGRPDLALRAFDALERRHVEADVAALHVDALRLSGKVDDAVAALGDYLGLFAVEGGGALARAASALVALLPGRGWVGISPDFNLIGQPGAIFSASTPEHGLVVRAEGCEEPLIGERVSFPAHFGLTGSVKLHATSVGGTLRLGWMPPAMAPRLYEENRGKYKPVALTQDESAPGSWRFEIQLGALGRYTRQEISLAVLLPDGRMAPLPGSPLSLASVRPYRAVKKPLPRSVRAEGVAIVIPVYRGEADTRACVMSVLETVPEGTSIVLVNDASPEPGVTDFMAACKRDPRLVVIENERNLGFPGAANRGMAAVPGQDVVLLNSDTVVFPGWLERLRAHADADASIATITPLSNAGSIASYPGGTEGTCTEETARLRDEVAAAANAGRHVDAPTGVGFCMFVRRACLNQVGAFDEQLFGRGYGEENDLCMRASTHGWRHVIAGDVYVLHRNGTSFGASRNGWMARNEIVLDQRHPDYKAQVDAFHKAQPLGNLRREIDIALLREDARPVALLLSLALAGGVERHVDARIEALERQGYRAMLVQPQADHSHVKITLPGAPGFQDLLFRVDDGIAAFLALLASLPVEKVELHHFLGLDAPFVDACLALDAPADIYIHDYSWYCPRLSLLSAKGGYCGEPGLAACKSCIAETASELHDDLGPEALRERSARWLGQARHVHVPCNDVRQRYARAFPGVNFEIALWQEKAPPAVAIADPVPHRIAIIGAIGEQKGRSVLLGCARNAALHNLALEFTLIGFSDEEEALLQSGKVFITGRYDEAELPELLQREAPSAIFLPSVTPETWSYSLSHAMATGLPIVAFDLGAIAERLKAGAYPHRLLPPHATPTQINAALMELHREGTEPEISDAPQAPINEVVSQSPLATQESEGSIMPEAGNALMSTAEFLTLARGLYHFSVMPTGQRAAGGVPMLPALQILGAPGQNSKDIEVVSAPGAEQQWLRSGEDSLILKVNSDSAKVVVMSLTAAGLTPLHIDVRKLDGEQGAYAFAEAHSLAPQAHAVAGQPPVAAPDASLLRAQIVAHVECVGDVIGMDQAWVGAADASRAIECLTITPMTNIAPAMIEYKVLSATGAETPWTDQGRPCGSRGRATPLLGVAIRQKHDAARRFVCEYTARFASGRVVGPLHDGAMCVSPLANDRLVGLWMHIVDHVAPKSFVPQQGAQAHRQEAPARAQALGPRFSAFREVSA